jgi:prepilin-type N-terminal cleavage/methylation domain-containing protein
MEGAGIHKRIKAFTLLELLVAMAITGLVVSIAGLAYNMLGRQFHTYKKESNEIASVFSFDSRLRTDILDAMHITWEENKLLLHRSEKEKLEYRFSGGYILRNDGARTDTFHIIPADIKLLYIGEEQEYGTVDEVYFEAEVLGEHEIFHYIKSYSASDLLNMEEE